MKPLEETYIKKSVFFIGRIIKSGGGGKTPWTTKLKKHFFFIIKKQCLLDLEYTYI